VTAAVSALIGGAAAGEDRTMNEDLGASASASQRASRTLRQAAEAVRRAPGRS
jgi:hypothetical protein